MARRQPRFHPHAGEAWFRALPHQERARFNREWREGEARGRELELRQVRGVLRSALPQVLIFVILNGFCPGDTGASYIVSLVVGAVLGLVLGATRADRLSSAMAGGLVFLVLQLATRGGLSFAHLFWIFPASAFSMLYGIEREE